MQIGLHPWNCSGLILRRWIYLLNSAEPLWGLWRAAGGEGFYRFFTCGNQSCCHGWNSTWVSVIAPLVFFVFVAPKPRTTIGNNMVSLSLFDQFWPTNFEELIRHSTSHPFCIFDFHDRCVVFFHVFFWGDGLESVHWLYCFLCFTIVAALIFSRDVILTSLCKRRNHFPKCDRKHVNSMESIYVFTSVQLLCIYFDMVQKAMSWYDLMPLIFVHGFPKSLSIHHRLGCWDLWPTSCQPAGLSEWCGASTLRHASVALLVGRRAFGHDIRWQESPRCDGLVWGGLDDGGPWRWSWWTIFIYYIYI